ncbi:MAG: protein-tyrosine sulfotransferase [Pirellulaceae bacterium]|jgi:protein-tyrosine sulfotransferase
MTQSHQGTVVFGIPRSGSTLLRQLLDAHPNISCVGNTGLFSACGRFLRREHVDSGEADGFMDRLESAGVDSLETVSQLRRFVFKVFDDIAMQRGALQWVSQTADDIFNLEEIEQLCGNSCRFITVHRHGADVACSLMDLNNEHGTFLPEVHRYICQYPMPLIAMANLWIDYARRLRAFELRHAHNVLVVNYDELVTQTEEVMSRILEFLGESAEGWSIEEAMYDTASAPMHDWASGCWGIDTTSVRRWQRLKPALIQRLAQVLNPTLEECGYDTISHMEAQPVARLPIAAIPLTAYDARSNH